ncbi:MAG: sigma-54 dependent transcriptional regulator [Bacteroidota bacterium]
MKKHGAILIVDNNEEILIALRLLLQDYFVSIECEKNPNLIPAHIDRQAFDVYILDMNFKSGRFTGNEGIFWMHKILEKDPKAVIVFLTAYGDIDLAVKAIKEGATDFIQKPWMDDKLISTILAAWKQRNSGSEVRDLRQKQEGLHQQIKRQGNKLIGSSILMKNLFRNIEKIARTDASVLVVGENGTGKELVAGAIHQQSSRASEVFVGVDMGSVSASLFESELFGHMKGSFTDANEDRPGRFEIAHKGSLFLDEIGNLPLMLQPKLLSVLQNRCLTRVGSNKAVAIDIRLITATNMPLDRMVRNGTFREDLLYRLNTITLHVPALRERTEDIPGLFKCFLKKFELKYAKAGLKVKPSVLDKLQNYHWPGNVRELEHAVEKAVIMCDSGLISEHDFTFHRRADEHISEAKQNLNLRRNEIIIIKKAIENCGGNLSQASRLLGITRKTLYNKINKYGV